MKISVTAATLGLVVGLAVMNAEAARFIKIAAEGDPVPGFPDLTISSAGTTAELNNHGVLSFSVTVTGAGVTSSNDRIRFIGPIGAPSLMYREGDQAAFPGATYQTDTRSRIADDGRLAMQLNLNGTPGGTADDTVTWLYDSGALTRVFQEGNPAPGFPGLTVANINVGGSGSLVPTSTGKLFHRLVLAGDGVTSANDVALYHGTGPGDLAPIAREGGLLPGAPAGARLNSIGALDARGDHVYMTGSMLQGQGGVTAADDFAVWITDDNGDLQIAVRQGDAVAGHGPGVLFDSVNEASFIDDGRLLAYSLLTGPNVVSSNDRGVLVGELGSPFTLIAREGDPAPGAGGALYGQSFGEIRFGNDGSILVQNVLTGPGVVTDNSQALFLGTGDDLQLLARRGEQAPGFAPGVNFQQWSNSGLTINDVGNVALLAPVSDGQGFNSQGLFVTTPQSDELQLLLKPGDMLEVAPGNFQEVAGIVGNYSSTQDGFNALNQLVFGVSFVGSGGALYVADISVPEPSSYALCACGLAFVASRLGRRR